MTKSINVVFDKFLPEEQRGKVNKPEWITRTEDLMSDVMDELRTIYAKVSEPKERSRQMQARIEEVAWQEIAGKGITPIAKLEIDPNGKFIKLAVTFQRSKDIPQEITLTTTTILTQK